MSESDSSSARDRDQTGVPAKILSQQAELPTQETLKDKIDQVLKTLTYREREIIKLRYGLDGGYSYTLDAVGRIFKVTRERVRQIEVKAVRKLQHPNRSRHLERFCDALAIAGRMAPEGYSFLLQAVFGACHVQREPNLFDFATSELSQDAFICWLLAWARCKLRANDAALHQTAVLLLNWLLRMHGIDWPTEYETLEIRRQFKGLDILVLANDDIALLIEDKTDTSMHSDQLRRYVDAVRTAYPDRRLAPIYFKTGDQTSYQAVEDAGWKCFLREDLLNALAYGKEKGVENDIFRDFHSRLMQMELKLWKLLGAAKTLAESRKNLGLIYKVAEMRTRYFCSRQEGKYTMSAFSSAIPIPNAGACGGGLAYRN